MTSPEFWQNTNKNERTVFVRSGYLQQFSHSKFFTYPHYYLHQTKSFHIENNRQRIRHVKRFLKRVTDPFVTTRTSRSVGMGLALLSQLMEQCEGTFSVRSKKESARVCLFRSIKLYRCTAYGQPVRKRCWYVSSLGQTTDLIYVYRTENGEFCLDTREMRRELGNEISLNEPVFFSG
jgi:hypothetical protein